MYVIGGLAEVLSYELSTFRWWRTDENHCFNNQMHDPSLISAYVIMLQGISVKSHNVKKSLFVEINVMMI